jgi:hypothetical protein
MGSNSATVNDQIEKENLISHFNIYRTLLALCKEEYVLYGDLNFPDVDDDFLFFHQIFYTQPKISFSDNKKM